jgi:hypothetical protein
MANPNVQAILADPKFQSLGADDQVSVLSRVDPNFAKLSFADQRQVIGHISNTVSIGGQQVDLKTGQGATSAATSQAGLNIRKFIHPISKSAGILQTGPTEVPDSNDPNATTMASGATDLGIPGNLTGRVQTQSINKADAQAKQALIGAGMALAPELIPEVAGGGAGATLANIGIRGANAGISGGAATVGGQVLTGENPLSTESLKETGQNAAIGAALGAGSKVVEAIPSAVKGAVNVAKDTFGEVKPPVEAPAVPKPVSSPVTVDSPFDDATIRKSVGGKTLSPDARETLRNAAGPVIQAGSSAENQLLKAVPVINDTISTQGAALDKILSNAAPLKESPEAAVREALDKLRENLPGGQEETLGKAITKEQTRYADALKSTSPVEINQTIRNLDERISDYNAPESQLEGPASAQDAALVTIRRQLRTALNNAIPDSAPINKTLANNIETRAVLRTRLGNVANDSSAANAQYQSELAKGQAQIAKDTADAAAKQSYDANVGRVKRNRTIAGVVGGGATVTGVGKLALDKFLSNKP